MSVREARLKVIASSPVVASWSRPFIGGGSTANLALPEACYFAGNEFIGGDDPRVDACTLRVTHEELWGNGIGERLTRSLGALAYKYGYPKLTAAINSQYSLDIFKRVFGEERMTYKAVNAFRQDGVIPLPTNFGQARRLLEQFEPLEESTLARNRGLETHIDLVGLDMSTWELPEEKAMPRFEWDMIVRPQT